MKVFTIRLIAIILIVSGVSLAAYATFRSSDATDKNLVFSDNTLLNGLWDNYKKIYWEAETGRTLDKQQDNITTSEGQSYTMLRAVWQSDRTTFDKSWAWTKEQLGRPNDALFAWKWGKRSDGTYGVFTDQGGQNTASDADSDIALALIMAANRWQQQSYLDEAKRILASIWEQEVITVQGKPYLAANDLEKNSSRAAILNPSYFAPYAYRIFAKIDSQHDWNGLINSSYELINTAMDAKLDKGDSARIVPDWISMDKMTGQIMAPQGASNLTTNYSFDAMRTAFRLALDYEWNREQRAYDTLAKNEVL